VAEFLQNNPGPLQSLTPTIFALPACAEVMAQARGKLQHHAGLAVIDRIPVERYSVTENQAIARLLAMMMGQLVAQKWDSTALYNVKDAGKPLGYGVRRSVTNLEQQFHTDGGWLRTPPEYVGLFCLQPAQEGGSSRFVSLMTVHNEMRHQHPELLPRLYRPFWWDRQAEHGPDEAKCCAHPVYRYDGHILTARYYEDYVLNGYKLAGEALDAEAVEALEAMRTISDAPENWVEFRVEKGQLQYINNRRFAHSRTAFIDAQPPHLRRHMVRLWNRNTGTPDLEE